MVREYDVEAATEYTPGSGGESLEGSATHEVLRLPVGDEGLEGIGAPKTARLRVGGAPVLDIDFLVRDIPVTTNDVFTAFGDHRFK